MGLRIRLGRRGKVAVVALAATPLVLVAAAPARAATLEGPWAPFSHCPVDHAEMIGNPPSSFGTGCVATVSPSGTFRIGDTTVETERTEIQFGIYGEPGSNTGVVVPATDGMTLQAEPAQVPGGLLGIVPPEALTPVLDPLNPVLGVTATVELAGEITDFSVSTADPVITLPVKIRLDNPSLGPNCYIGGDEEPIILQPRVVGELTGGSVLDPNGFPVFILQLEAALADDTFAVPEARGCGPLGQGMLDPAVNTQVGLPSPEGQNELMLQDVAINLALTQQGGQVLSDAWHASVIEP